MKYNFHEMGKRIKEKRKSMKWSQDKLIEELAAVGVKVGRNTVSDVENGSGTDRLDVLIALSDLFSVDIGYLLAMPEYEHTETAIEQIICENTGLSHTAARVLMAEKREIDKIVSTPAGFLFHWSDNLFGVVSFLLENSANGSGGLLDLIRAYLTTPENATIQGLPDDTITVKGRRGFHVSAPQLLSGVLLDRIQQTLIEYRLQLQKRKKAKK